MSRIDIVIFFRIYFSFLQDRAVNIWGEPESFDEAPLIFLFFIYLSALFQQITSFLGEISVELVNEFRDTETSPDKTSNDYNPNKLIAHSSIYIDISRE